MIGSAGGAPYETMAVPGRDLGLQLLLGRERRRRGRPGRAAVPDRRHRTRTAPIEVQNFDAVRLRRGDEKVSDALGISIALADFGEYTLLIAKRDPGQGIVWAAFLCLIAGITITFYRPRRRIWARARAGRPPRHWSSAPTAMSMSSASSARCSTISSRSADPAAGVTTLHDLHRALFPTARPVGRR